MASKAAQDIITEAISERGLSYDDAIRWCEAKADALAAPYREAADELRLGTSNRLSTNADGSDSTSRKGTDPA